VFKGLKLDLGQKSSTRKTETFVNNRGVFWSLTQATRTSKNV